MNAVAISLPPMLPILPLRNCILLPSSVRSVVLASAKSIKLIEHHLARSSRDSGDELLVGVVPLIKDAEGNEDLHTTGVAARVLSMTRTSTPRRMFVVLLEGRCRFSVTKVVSEDPFYVAKVTQLDFTEAESDAMANDLELNDLAESFKASARGLMHRLELAGASGPGMVRLRNLLENVPAHRLADLFSAAFEERFDRRLALLNLTCPKERLKQAKALLDTAILAADSALGKGPMRRELSPSQRNLLRQQQLQALRGDMGASDMGAAQAEAEPEDDLTALERRLVAASLPREVLRMAKAELAKLRRSNDNAPWYASSKSWVEWVAALPWVVDSPAGAAAPTLLAARERLDLEHFGLDKIKQRIIEYLAVRRLRPTAKPPILCFLGPPGVGKTSLAKSIAKALGRPFARISLGGVRDEADIRGHRRTYVSSMPGRIIQALRRTGARDPVLLLDEVDKMGADSRGDPAAALLEVLDPEQNGSFTDHYLNVPFDLSRVTFLCTANSGGMIPAPLMDRLEVIRLSGYTHEEKLNIAMRHILPRILRDHGLMVSPTAPGREDGGRDDGEGIGADTGADAPPSAEAAGAGGGSGLPSVQRDATVHCGGLRALELSAAAPRGDLSWRGAGAGASASAGAGAGAGALFAGAGGPEFSGREWGVLAAERRHARILAGGAPHSWRALPRFAGEGPSADLEGSASLGGQAADAERSLILLEVDEDIVAAVVTGYTREAGVRGLERALSALCRAAAVEVAGRTPDSPEWNRPIRATMEMVEKALGPAKYTGTELTERPDVPGVVTGLVWTEVGGQVQFIECTSLPSAETRGGQLHLTGQLGDVIKESAQIALSWVKSRERALGLGSHLGRVPSSAAAADAGMGLGVGAADGLVGGGAGVGEGPFGGSPLSQLDVHIHLPQGSVPKDGPSAGISMCTALVSLFSGRPTRTDTAMTGEVTLTGIVLPIGGVKEKLIAAQRAGVKRVIIPARNIPDVEQEVPEATRAALHVIGVSTMAEVLQEAFEGGFVPAVSVAAAEGAGGGRKTGGVPGAPDDLPCARL